MSINIDHIDDKICHKIAEKIYEHGFKNIAFKFKHATYYQFTAYILKKSKIVVTYNADSTFPMAGKIYFEDFRYVIKKMGNNKYESVHKRWIEVDDLDKYIEKAKNVETKYANNEPKMWGIIPSKAAQVIYYKKSRTVKIISNIIASVKATLGYHDGKKVYFNRASPNLEPIWVLDGDCYTPKNGMRSFKAAFDGNKIFPLRGSKPEYIFSRKFNTKYVDPDNFTKNDLLLIKMCIDYVANGGDDEVLRRLDQ